MCWFRMRAWWRALSLRAVVHVPTEDAWLCILSSPPSPGHLGFLAYIPLGGVPNELQTSRVLLLVLRCIYIPDPVGCYVASRANHGCIKLCVGLGCVLRGVHLVACAFSACCGACSHRGRMAVYSQQPTFSGAPWFPGVHSAWWRPKRTADKSSAAPCVALHLYSDPVGCYVASRANHGCIKLCVGLGCVLGGARLLCVLWCMFPERTHGYAFSAAHLLRGTLVSWCTFRLVASQTNCRQVECCSLCCAASIFLTQLVAMWLAGQTMDASSYVLV